MWKRDWQSWVIEGLIILGGMMLLWAGLTSLKTVLAAPLSEESYLASELDVRLPLPQVDSIRSTQPAEDDIFFPLVHNPLTPTPTPTLTPTPTPVPAGRVIRVKIPNIGVDRAVVPLGQYRNSRGVIEYDTDSLFATSSRQDLVGQTQTSVNPGEGSNIVLVGHNYNRGWFAWEGVFVNIHKLKKGDKITLKTENGGKYTYEVTKVIQVPWTSGSAAEWEKHLKYLGPSANEKVTLVTCGGLFGSWTARYYVIAK